jgi:hypothetical protein
MLVASILFLSVKVLKPKNMEITKGTRKLERVKNDLEVAVLGATHHQVYMIGKVTVGKSFVHFTQAGEVGETSLKELGPAA